MRHVFRAVLALAFGCALLAWITREVIRHDGRDGRPSMAVHYRIDAIFATRRLVEFARAHDLDVAPRELTRLLDTGNPWWLGYSYVTHHNNGGANRMARVLKA